MNIELLDRPLKEFDFGPIHTVRLRQMFENYAVWKDGKYTYTPLLTVCDLVVLTEREILAQPNIGKRSLEVLKKFMRLRGLHFGMQFSGSIEKEVEARVGATLEELKLEIGYLRGLHMREHRALVAIAKAIGPVIFHLNSSKLEREIDVEDIKELNKLISEPYDGLYKDDQ